MDYSVLDFIADLEVVLLYSSLSVIVFKILLVWSVVSAVKEGTLTQLL